MPTERATRSGPSPWLFGLFLLLAFAFGAGVATVLHPKTVESCHATSVLVRLDGCTLTTAQVTKLDLRAGSFRGAQLRKVDLRGKDLRGADLSGAQMDGADLTDARLDGANFSGADLQGAILRNACMRGTDFRRSSIATADLRDADLRFAVLSSGFKAGAARSSTSC